MKKVLIIFVLLSILLLASLLSQASSPFKQKFFDGRLSLLYAPLVGQKATMKLDLTSVLGDCGAATIKFNVPDGVSILGRSMFEEPSFIKGLSRQYSVEIEVLEEGTYALQASVYFQNSGNHQKVEHFFTYLIAGNISSHSTDKVNSLTVSKNGIQTLRSSLAPPKAQGTFSMSGYITYYNDNLSKAVPIKKLMVQLFETKLNGIELLGTSYTNNDGLYSFDNVINPDGTMRDLQMKISFDNDILRLIDNNNEIYRFDLPPIENVSGGSISIDYFLNNSNQYRSLGHIFNIIIDAYDFLKSKLNWSRQKINVKWPYQDTNSIYTYMYRLNGSVSNECINIVADRQWERTSMLHEYGHSVMTALYDYNFNNLPKENFHGDPDKDFTHYINTVSDPGFAIKEGWAEFFEALVDDNAYNTTQYSNANTPNIEYNEWWKGTDENNTKGEIVEGIVASILWDIADSTQSIDEVPNSDDDNISGSTKELWDLMSKYRPSDIIEFWNYWTNHSYGQVNALYSIYLNNHVKVLVPYDVNEDGKIDIFDLNLASSYFGKSILISMKDNPDVNRDGKVTIIDLIIISRNMTP